MAIVTINVENKNVIITRRCSSFGNGMSFDITEISIMEVLKLLREKIKSCILK